MLLSDSVVGLPMPYMQLTELTTMTSLRPERRAEVEARRSLSISSLMARSFSMYVSVEGMYASGW